MAQCRFHAQSEAVSYCGTCRALFCRRCGTPGKTCSLCKRTALSAPPSAPILEAQIKAKRCFKHPKDPGAKPCHECGTPRCAQCLNWQGICPACAPKFPVAGEAETEDASPKKLKKRRKSEKPDLSYTGGLNRHKGWQRQFKRMVIGGILLAGIGWVLQFQFGVFKEFASKAGDARKKMQGMQALNAGNARNADMASMMQRLESGAVTESDVSETERLMAKIEAGEEVDSGQRDALSKLSRLYQQGKAPEASDPQTQKMWALLSDWSNDEEAADSAAQRPASRPAARPRKPQPAAAAQAVPWKVSLLAPANGAKVQGLVSVSARIEGQGYIDRVEFLVNGEWQGLSNRPPFRFDWDTTGSSNGAKTLEVVAYEPSGTRHASRRVRVTVAN